MLVLGAATSCNKSSDTETFVYPANLAVTEFSLSADSKNPGLDSAYFSIDLEHKVIFNADSLRKGTRIDKVVPKITFNSTVSEATIVMTGGTTRVGEVDYQKNPTDSIDFTGKVELRIKANDGSIGTTYRLKVNVHKENPDTLVWSDFGWSQLPSRLPSPVASKSVQHNKKIFTLIEESDGTYTLVTSTPNFSDRTVEQLFLPFTPQIRTLALTDNKAMMLASDGTLWESSLSMIFWNSTPEKWEAMIGAYTTSAVGIREDNGQKVFAQYPLENLNVKEIPEDFPLRGFTNLVTLVNQWTLSPVAFITGGVTADGGYSDVTWAFDGTEWIKLSQGGIPALSGASIIPYYNFRPSADGKTMIEYKVWMLIGGKRNDGEFNRTVYVSYDNGVNWAKGVNTLQLPPELPAMTDCDNVVSDKELEGNLSDAWTRSGTSGPQKVSYTLDGDYVIWQCPYIYLLGGTLPDGTLSTKIWRGVLNRLRFMPIV